ncbi:MAG: InlB B-repeat-containing protein [Clostridia bacterium]|nr:InlB B-repeat-containing protein [Clostridia bacterium]
MKALLSLFCVFLALAFLIVAADNSIPDEDETTTTYEDFTTTIPDEPTTDDTPTTEAPTTEAPTTEAPTTEAPTTEAPTTEAPTTEAPSTEAPTTTKPTTPDTPVTPVQKVTVRFDSAGGSSVPSQTIELGGTVKKPANPTKNGYIFKGWYSNDKEWDFAKTIVVRDTTLTAKWEFDSSSITDIVGTMDDEFSIKITSKSLPAGKYTLRYENANGVMSNYEEIGTITLNVTYKGFIPSNKAPMDATMIGVYNSNGTRVGSIIIPESFRKDFGKKLYSFGALSDVHIGYPTAEEDFERALKYLADTEKVEFITIAGDLTVKATLAQFKTFRSIIDKHCSVPVYAIAGNHDTPEHGGPSVTDLVVRYTENPLYYSFTEGNDVYIMLGVAQESSFAHMAPGALQWLQTVLEQNKDKRCFIVTHVYTNNSSGDPFNVYGHDMWAGDEEEIFMSLLNHYPNVTVFHGHSHVEFALQSLTEKAIIDVSKKYNSIHVPSVTAPRTCKLVDGLVEDNHYLYEESEGYVVDVYENGIVLRGYDFVNAKFIPYAHYYIDTTLKTVAPNTYVDPTGTIK